MRRLVGLVFAAGGLSLASPARAQNAAPTGMEPAPATAGVLAPTAGGDAGQHPRFGRNQEHSVGFRFWVWNTPAWEVGLFAHVEPGWSGPLTLALGPEYVYRKAGLDIVLGLQYTSFGADPGFFRGRSESDVALERVHSQLWGLYVNALFLWGTRFNDWFELQYGAGVGLGYVGGDLFRTQVYRNPQPDGPLAECGSGMGESRPPPGGVPAVPSNGGYCDTANNHYLYSDGSRYSEPRLTGNPSGNIPPVLPWISLPHIALHFRPHRYFDVRVDAGFALVGFYSGVALHYVFD